MGNITQLEKVKARIRETGYVDNFWAIDNYILRLGAIILMLRKQGMKLEGKFGKELGKDRPLWKNFYYHIDKFIPRDSLPPCPGCNGDPGDASRGITHVMGTKEHPKYDF